MDRLPLGENTNELIKLVSGLKLIKRYISAVSWGNK